MQIKWFCNIFVFQGAYEMPREFIKPFGTKYLKIAYVHQKYLHNKVYVGLFEKKMHIGERFRV